MGIVDFHSHLLPGIDDGSRNPEMTRHMLQAGAEQGIGTFVATPHFYPQRTGMEGFLRRREAACEKILPLAEELGISVLPGAEVALCPGLGRGEEVERLCITGTRLMLVEMPFREWTSRDLGEVERLLERDIRPVMAHLERYLLLARKDLIRSLLELPVFVQLNAECLLDWRTRGRALRLLRQGRAHLLGSDAHNLTSRPVNLAQGRQVIWQRLGAERLEEMDRLCERLLAGAAEAAQ